MVGMDVVAIGGGRRHEADGIGDDGLPVGFPNEADGVGDQAAARRRIGEDDAMARLA
jgi:hypothetical protein